MQTRKMYGTPPARHTAIHYPDEPNTGDLPPHGLEFASVMAVVAFTLSEEGAVTLQTALACILKFSDDVCLEARKDKLVLTALNLSRSAYLAFTFTASRFFSRYKYEGNAQCRERFFCVLYIRVGPPFVRFSTRRLFSLSDLSLSPSRPSCLSSVAGLAAVAILLVRGRTKRPLNGAM